MRKRVTVYFWLLVACLIALWLSGFSVGFSVGTAHADTCTGWSGRFVNFSQCDGYTCQGVSFGPFYTRSCNEPPPPPPTAP